MLPLRRALLSVYDKRGLDDFARGLRALGIEIISTGGTRRFLESAGVEVQSVSEITGFPEILDGRVKSLHPRIHGGILADRGRSGHAAQLQEHGIAPIDLVAVNLYPFKETVAGAGAAFGEVIEMIDIGGPSMLRGAAKNHQGVVVVIDPDDYPQVLAALEGEARAISEKFRRRLAVKAFRHSQSYDAAVAEWLEKVDFEESGGEAHGTLFSGHLNVDLDLRLEPRYGENPHQAAAIYEALGGPGVFGGFDQLQGKDLSWNNLLDADAARKISALFDEPAVVIVKHNNPCGVGRGGDPVEAYRRALACDPVSAFGSIIALNRPANGAFAEAMGDLFVEVVIAPSFGEEARRIFSAKKNLRLIECPRYEPSPREIELRSIAGGFLAQTPDTQPDEPEAWVCHTRRRPTDKEASALELAWKAMRHTKSNAIVLANEHQTVGIGAGQMSRVDSCRLAIEKARTAGLEVKGSVAASDAFFPFRDGLDALAEAGVTAVAQPGGSQRDAEVIAAADEQGLAMVMTGRRHFRH